LGTNLKTSYSAKYDNGQFAKYYKEI
jgi:hypothetical protein